MLIMISSTPIRKSFINQQKQNDEPPYTPLDPHTDDDDNERRNRRSLYDAERRLQSVPETENIEQLTCNIKLCQKLFNENKINVRNAWDVRVIDYIYQFVSKNAIIDSKIILLGASSLEVCVKVYGCKVEYLGQEIVKLVSTKSIDDQDDSAAEDGAPDDDAAPDKRKPKKKKRLLKTTIAKHKSDVLITEIPKVVPTHFVGNIDIYANTYQNMSTNKIHMDHTVYRFNLLNDVDHGFVSYILKDSTHREQVYTSTIVEVKSFTICPQFRNFNVDEEDNEYNDSIAGIMTDSRRQMNSLVTDEVVYDENGVPVPELDGSVHDIFADHMDDVNDGIEETEAVGQVAQQRRMEMITSFCPSEKHSEREKSINNSISSSFLETIWVGPSHWKNKLVRPSAPRYSGKSEEKVPRVKNARKTIVRRKYLGLDFNGANEMDRSSKYKMKALSYDLRKCTLPPNIFAEMNNLLLSMSISPKYEYGLQRTESEYEHSPYDYNNADDSQYCSQVDILDVDGDAHDSANKENDDVLQEPVADQFGQTLLNGLSHNLNATGALIDAPDLVAQTYVPYALRAKNVNMKRLKSAMLKCLTGDSNTTIVSDKIQIQPTCFTNVYIKLPSKLPKKVSSEISVPLAYFSLLHITNEHNLKLSESLTLDDIQIEKL